MKCFAESLQNDTPKSGGFNLTETIGQGQNCPRINKRNSSNCAFLLQQYNQNSEQYRTEVIKPLFYNACKESGCKISGEYRNFTITFTCHCGRPHDEARSKKKTERAREKKAGTKKRKFSQLNTDVIMGETAGQSQMACEADAPKSNEVGAVERTSSKLNDWTTFNPDCDMTMEALTSEAATTESTTAGKSHVNLYLSQIGTHKTLCLI